MASRISARSKFTPAALQAFRRMEIVRYQCTCPPIDWGGEYWKRPDPCAACEEWWKAHNTLHDELRLPVYQWPALEYPDDECPYPDGCPTAQQWHERRAKRHGAFELYRALKAAAEKG